MSDELERTVGEILRSLAKLENEFNRLKERVGYMHRSEQEIDLLMREVYENR